MLILIIAIFLIFGLGTWYAVHTDETYDKINGVIKYKYTNVITDLKPGDDFSCRIDGDRCVGKIQIISNRVYLCQDVSYGVAPAWHSHRDKMGYAYSWFAGYIYLTKGINTRVLQEFLQSIEKYRITDFKLRDNSRKERIKRLY